MQEEQILIMLLDFIVSGIIIIMLFDKVNYEGHVNHKLLCNNSALHLSVITSIIRNDLMVFPMMNMNGKSCQV